MNKSLTNFDLDGNIKRFKITKKDVYSFSGNFNNYFKIS